MSKKEIVVDMVGKILIIRGKRVMLDRDLAKLYGVATKILLQSVKRNNRRFPEDFTFRLTALEAANLRSQIVTSSWGGSWSELKKKGLTLESSKKYNLKSRNNNQDNAVKGVAMRKIFILSYMFVFFLSSCAFASEPQDTKENKKQELPYTKEIGIISGYAHTKLQEKGSYKIIPVILRLGYSLDSVGLGFCDLIRPIADKLKMKPKGYTGLMNEFNLNGVLTPDSNLEAGWTLLIKYSYPVTEKFHPYCIGGVGLAYITQHTREQSMQWGFTPQFGTGFSYFFKKNMALNVEYRRRHFSNANIKRPNGGINVNMFLAGVSWFY